MNPHGKDPDIETDKLNFARPQSQQLFPPPLQPKYLNEALLLMAKVHYVQGRYRDAQGMCARVGLEELTKEDQPTYHLRLLAEAFVIKGTGNHAGTFISEVRLSVSCCTDVWIT